MSTDYLQKALRTFNTDKPNWYGWKTHEDNGDKIPNTDRMQHKYIKVIKEGATIPSKSDLDAKIAELKTAYDANEYQRDRAIAYKELKEQFDLLYHDMVADKGDKTGEWFKHIKAVKDANPKP